MVLQISYIIFFSTMERERQKDSDRRRQSETKIETEITPKKVRDRLALLMG